MQLFIGVLCGIFCACAHSGCYLFTRDFLTRPKRSSFQLLCIGHVYMGVISLILLPFFWRTPASGWAGLAIPLAGSALFYLLAQLIFFKVLTWVSASNISPLLGIKIVFIALLASFTGAAELGWAQWTAVGIALLAMGLLWRGGGKLPMKVIGGGILTAACYAGSDTFILKLLDAMNPEHGISDAVFCTALNYLLCMVIGLAGLPLCKEKTGVREFREAIWFSLSWYAAMLFLFSAFALLGIVPGVILQSTRGPLSVGLGILIAHLGHHRLEEKILLPRAISNLIAALLMCAAVAFYFYHPKPDLPVNEAKPAIEQNK